MGILLAGAGSGCDCEAMLASHRTGPEPTVRRDESPVPVRVEPNPLPAPRPRPSPSEAGPAVATPLPPPEPPQREPTPSIPAEAEAEDEEEIADEPLAVESESPVHELQPKSPLQRHRVLDALRGGKRLERQDPLTRPPIVLPRKIRPVVPELDE